MSGLPRALMRQVGEPDVLARPADLAAYAYDAFGASGERHLPDAVAFPASTEEVAGAVQVSAQHGVPVVPRGAGTCYAGGAIATPGSAVVTPPRMTRTLVVEAKAERPTVPSRVAGGHSGPGAAAAIAKARLVRAAIEFLARAAMRAVARTGISASPDAAGALLIGEVEGDAATVRVDAEAVAGALV